MFLSLKSLNAGLLRCVFFHFLFLCDLLFHLIRSLFSVSALSLVPAGGACVKS